MPNEARFFLREAEYQNGWNLLYFERLFCEKLEQLAPGSIERVQQVVLELYLPIQVSLHFGL